MPTPASSGQPHQAGATPGVHAEGARRKQAAMVNKQNKSTVQVEPMVDEPHPYLLAGLKMLVNQGRQPRWFV